MTESDAMNTVTDPTYPALNDPRALLGRAQELECLRELLQGRSPAVTVTGPVGVGKSALVAALLDVMTEPPERLWIDLGPARDMEDALARVEVALGGAQAPQGQSAAAWLSQRLRELGPGLLVFEHVEAHLSWLVPWMEGWLRGATRQVIVTSRERLGLVRESLLELGPLSAPGPNAPLQERLQSDAVQLFVQRARALDPRYWPSPEELEQIATLTHRLDGLPLAIELAAARHRMLSVQDLLVGLERRQSILAQTRGAQATSLDGALMQSWETLDAVSQQALASLSLMRGRFDATLAEALIAHALEPGQDALDVLQGLRDRSLLAQDPQTRQLSLYQVIQRFARQRLDLERWRAPAQQALLSRMGERAREWAHALELYGRLETLRAMERAQDPMRDALELVLGPPQDDQPSWDASSLLDGLGLARALGQLMEIKGTLTQRRALLARVVPWASARLEHQDAQLREAAALTLTQCMRVMHRISDHDGLDAMLEVLGASPRPPRVEAKLMTERARRAERAARWDEAEELAQRAQTLLTQLEQPLWATMELINLGSVSYWKGDLELARERFEQALQALERLGADCYESIPLCNLTLLCAIRADRAAGRAFGRRAIERFKALGDLCGEGTTWNFLGMLHVNLHERDAARQCFEQALSLQERSGNLTQAAYTHANLASMAVIALDEDAVEHHIRASERTIQEGLRGVMELHNAGLRAELHERRGEWSLMAQRLTQALEHPERRHDPEQEAYYMGLLGVAQVMMERRAEAARTFDAMEQRLDKLPSSPRVEAARQLPQHLALGAQAMPAQAWITLRDQLVESLRGCFEEPPGDSSPPAAKSVWHRNVARTLWRRLSDAQRQEIEAMTRDPHGEALCVAYDMSMMRLPKGEWAEVGNRRNVQRLLELLVAAHQQRRACPEDEIISALWPEERIQPEAAANRLYNAVALLRATGIKPWLHKREEGYTLEESLRVITLDSPHELSI